MSRTLSRRLLGQSLFKNSNESSISTRLTLRCLRPFSNTPKRRADEDEDLINFLENAPTPPEKAPTAPTPRLMSEVVFRSPSLAPKARLSPEAQQAQQSAKAPGGMEALAALLQTNNTQRATGARTQFLPSYHEAELMEGSLQRTAEDIALDPHLFSVYALRHNTHITIMSPKVEGKKGKDGTKETKDTPPKVLLSMSCGNIGFKKSARKHYDSAFQLASYVMVQAQNKGIVAQIRKLEVRLRGFGAGREAVTKALLGSEGRFLRGKIVKVSDSTRLKFGGTRSKKPRRLG